MRILVIAPHADDELLGCGGMLLRAREEGHTIAWLLVTSIQDGFSWGENKIQERVSEISQVREGLGILPKHFYNLMFVPAELDSVSQKSIYEKISDAITNFEPDDIFIPHFGDIHSDHKLVFALSASCSKWFRYPFIKRVFSYETVSETDFSLRPSEAFIANYYINISGYLDKKIELMKIYKSEFRAHPFPRSEEVLQSLARLRGAQAGYAEAEAFSLLRCRI
jgi:LmbE family N-acetylglucosaminyl deacetylase